MKLFTTLPLDEISRYEALQGAERNEAKKILATEATTLLHGAAAAREAEETARKTFEEGAVAEGLPAVEIALKELQSGLGLLTALVKVGLSSSNSEARRSIKGGAVRLNDVSVSDEKRVLQESDIGADGAIKLSMGKKRHALIKLAG